MTGFAVRAGLGARRALGSSPALWVQDAEPRSEALDPSRAPWFVDRMLPRDPAFTDDLQGRPPGPDDGDDGPLLPPRGAEPRWPALIALAGALVGALFSALSTTDFMQHLDRQVHAIHCSFLPGAAKDLAESGCRTVMMSPYSSLFREQLWGGIPIALGSLAVFAFLAYRAALLAWRRDPTSGETQVLLAAAAVPVVVSVAYGALSVAKLDALCKVCVGIYAASAVTFAGALLAWRGRQDLVYGKARLGAAVAEAGALVAAVALAYAVLVPEPDARTSLLGCGSLVRAEDTAGVMIPLAPHAGGTPSIEVLDPLCPSCKAFDARLGASGLGERLDLAGVLFPLDSECNWMVTEAIHPGACAVSEAVLCAAGLAPGARDAAAARAVLSWAFDRQAELRALAARDRGALRAELEREFPRVKGCLGGALVRSRLGKSLRWAVANAIPVLTPQLFVAGSRVCDEDTDLGLEYTLARMLSPAAEQERARRRPTEPRPSPSPPAEGVVHAAAVAPPAPAAPAAEAAEPGAHAPVPSAPRELHAPAPADADAAPPAAPPRPPEEIHARPQAGEPEPPPEQPAPAAPAPVAPVHEEDAR
jgi:uncharacterized membrane protein